MHTHQRLDDLGLDLAAEHGDRCRLRLVQAEPTCGDKKGRAPNIVEALPSGETGFARTIALNPDILTLDISLPDISGLEVAKRLRSAGCGAKIVFLSNNRDPEVVRGAFDLGASGYVFKSQIIPDLTMPSRWR